jgi:Peptidase inhibitor family I36
MRFMNSLGCAVFVMMVVGLAAAQYGDYSNKEPRYGACFYKDADFRGESFCMWDGERAAQVPPAFNDKISSVRIYGRVEITVYQDTNFGGPSLQLRDNVPNLQSYQQRPGHSWNDRISSIAIGSDRGYWDGGGNGDRDRDRDHDRDRDRGRDWRWDQGGQGSDPQDGVCFFKDINFGGERFCLSPGDRVQEVPPGFNDKISSIRIYGRAAITLYQDANFRGNTLRVRDDVPNLRSFQVSPGHSWNDRVSSIRVY